MERLPRDSIRKQTAHLFTHTLSFTGLSIFHRNGQEKGFHSTLRDLRPRGEYLCLCLYLCNLKLVALSSLFGLSLPHATEFHFSPFISPSLSHISISFAFLFPLSSATHIDNSLPHASYLIRVRDTFRVTGDLSRSLAQQLLESFSQS